MELTHEEVGLFSLWKREVRELYERAFPDVERLPFGMLLVNALRGCVRLEAHVLGGSLAAITYSVESDEGTYLVLSTQPDISSERLRQIVGKLAPMSYRPRIVDAAEAGVPEGDEA